MSSVTYITTVLVLLSVVRVGLQHCMIENQNEMHKLSKINTIKKQANKYAATFP